MSFSDGAWTLSAAMGIGAFLLALFAPRRAQWIGYVSGFALAYIAVALTLMFYANAPGDVREGFTMQDRALLLSIRPAIIWANLGLIAILIGRGLRHLWRRTAPRP